MTKGEVKEIHLDPIMTDQEAESMAAKMLQQEDCRTLIEQDADVYCAETGITIAKFRKGLVPRNVQKDAFNNLLTAAVVTDNRGISGGAPDGKTRTPRILKDGQVSKTTEAITKVNSGIIGYFDRNPRIPYCRQTAFNQKKFDKFKKAYPIIKCVDNLYKELMPIEHQRQMDAVSQTHPEWVIPGTSFTTVTVNKNWQTAVHQDKGDYREGFGNLVALRKGRYTGGHFVVVKWGVGFDLQNGDILLADVHQWHGNTPINKIDAKAIRLSLVMYYREKMMICGTPEEELRRAQLKTTNNFLNEEV